MSHLALLTGFIVVLGGSNVLCSISLNVAHETQGVRGESVIVPCAYTPSETYKEYELHWCYDDTEILYRFESQSHILKADFQDKIKVSDTKRGDVSLIIQRLRTIDRGNYKCKVVWKTNDGHTVIKEGVSKLTVLRVHPPTKKPEKDPITQTKEKNINTGTVQNKPFNTESSQTTRSSQLTESRLPPTSTESMRIQGFDAIVRDYGVPLYILLLIGLACALSIVALIIVFISRRRRKSYNYNVPTMSQLAMRQDSSPMIVDGCQPCSNPAARAQNQYQPCQQLKESEYEAMVTDPNNEYEFLIPEQGTISSCPDQSQTTN